MRINRNPNVIERESVSSPSIEKLIILPIFLFVGMNVAFVEAMAQ
jgi:hypothetical protein